MGFCLRGGFRYEPMTIAASGSRLTQTQGPATHGSGGDPGRCGRDWRSQDSHARETRSPGGPAPAGLSRVSELMAGPRVLSAHISRSAAPATPHSQERTGPTDAAGLGLGGRAEVNARQKPHPGPYHPPPQTSPSKDGHCGGGWSPGVGGLQGLQGTKCCVLAVASPAVGHRFPPQGVRIWGQDAWGRARWALAPRAGGQAGLWAPPVQGRASRAWSGWETLPDCSPLK